MGVHHATEEQFNHLCAAIAKSNADLVEFMPDEKAALKMMHAAYERLKQLGFADGQYCPKDGSAFEVVDLGSTGIFRCTYSGDWPDGYYMIEDGGDIWPTRRSGMWRPLPAESSAHSPTEGRAGNPAPDDQNPHPSRNRRGQS
jgi:hypothetical protein